MAHNVFHRSPDPVVARSASGSMIFDEEGRGYLDAAGGAVASSIGHGDPRVADAMAKAARTLDYVHASHFTSRAVEDYATGIAQLVPTEGCHVFPVSGGSEAVETALKLARAYHVANGEPERHVIIARRGAYHGNSRGALDVSHRPALQTDYAPWLGQSARVSAAYPYRDERSGMELAEEFRFTVDEIGPERVAAFVAEPISGATLAASVPVDDYWSAMADVCREYGIVLIADEVMTGFGRTGTWFASDHWDLKPDIMTCGKGASSGYWPLGLCVASDRIHDVVPGAAFMHGFTWSHHPIGAAVAQAVLDVIVEDALVLRSQCQGALLGERLSTRLGSHPLVGDIRGRGLLWGVELVADRADARPFDRAQHVAERVYAQARGRGVIVYLSTGLADGVDGDALLLGPPFTITDSEIDVIVETLAAALDAVSKELSA